MRIHYDAIAIVEGEFKDDMIEMDNVLYQVVKSRYLKTSNTTVVKLQDYYD